MTIRWIFGLGVLALATPAFSAPVETAAPVQAVVQQLGDKPVLAYYTRGNGTCDAVLMTHQEPGPRVRVSLMPDQTATIEDVSGAAIRLTCGMGAAQMIVERKPAELSSANAR